MANLSATSTIEIPVFSIGFETADLIKAQLSNKANTFVNATFSKPPIEVIDQMQWFSLYFYGIAFPLIVITEIIVIVINRVVGGADAELIAACLVMISAFCA